MIARSCIFLFVNLIFSLQLHAAPAVKDEDIIGKIKGSSEYISADSYDRYAMIQSYAALPESLKNLVKYLQAGNYKGINAYIDQLTNQRQDKLYDYQLERNISTALMVVSNQRYLSQQAVDEWVAQTPEHYFPHLIKAAFYIEAGYKARGKKYVSETSEQKFREMKRLHEIGLLSLNRCLELNPKFEFAYAEQISYLRASSGTEDAARAAYEKGLAINPYSFDVRWAYLDYNKPEWHGDGATTKMEAILQSLGVEKNKNAGLEAMKGRVLVLQGDRHQKIWSNSLDNKDFLKALQYYDQALSYGDLYYYHYRKAMLLFSFHDYEEAIKHFKRAAEISPYNEEAHKRYIWAMDLSGALAPDWDKKR